MKRNILILITAFILAGLLAYPPTSLAQEKWDKNKAPMPTPRSHLCTSVVNGLIYAIGGGAGQIAAGNDVQTPVASFEVYNPATDQWTKKKDMSIARKWFVTIVVNGKIYVIGGRTAVERRGKKIEKTVASVEEYDPATDTWTKKADVPVPRDRGTAAFVNGKIYLISGGQNVGGLTPKVEVYDLATDTWADGTPIPTRRLRLSGGVLNGKIYVFGGFKKENHWVEIVEEYDPATNTWTRKADMPTPRWRLSPSTPAAGGRFYVIGGENNGQIVPSTEEFDPAKNVWTKRKKMPTPRDALATAVVKGKIYAIGGWDGNNVLGTVEEYTPDGWPFAVSPQGKLAITWGAIKTTD